MNVRKLRPDLYEVERDLRRALAKDEEVELDQDVGIIMRSPNGTRWRITVSDAGALQVSPA